MEDSPLYIQMKECKKAQLETLELELPMKKEQFAESFRKHNGHYSVETEWIFSDICKMMGQIFKIEFQLKHWGEWEYDE